MKKLLTIAFFVSFCSLGQEAVDNVLEKSNTHQPQAKLVLENPEIRIGEPAVIHLSFQFQDPYGEAMIGWPQYDDKLTEDIEILDRTMDFQTPADSVNHIYIREQNISVTAWKEGLYLIPAQGIEMNDSVYYTNTEMLHVNTVEVDTSKGIFDIADNYTVEYTVGERTKDWLAENWYWLAGAGLLTLLFLLFRIVKNRKEDQEEKQAPKIPAHITALKNLHDLRSKEAWKTEDKKEYYSILTNTVRLYLEQRFGIYAMEQTTREIIQNLRNSDISEEDKDFLRKILAQADMVKFAKFNPQEEDGYTSLMRSIEFVEQTKREKEEEESEEEENKNLRDEDSSH